MSTHSTAGIVAIIRLRTEVPPNVAQALSAGGIDTVEVTLPTPGSLQTVTRWRAETDLRVGVGTIRTGPDAKAAIEAGAQFLVTPTIDDDALAEAANAGIPVYCGASTPTEIERAFRSPAVAAVKVFPVGAFGGPSYIKAIRDPLPDIPLLPTGGVSVHNTAEYAALGAVGVGVGGALVNQDLITAGDWDGLRERAAQFAAAWSKGQA